MVEIRLQEIKKVDLRGGVVIEGFPGIVWVGTISSACLFSSLRLELAGTIESEDFPSLAMVYASEPNAPARRTLLSESFTSLAQYYKQAPEQTI